MNPDGTPARPKGVLRGLAVVLALLAPVGCAASISSPHPDTLHTVTAGYGDAGRTVRIHLGDFVRVRLTSTYWQFARVRGHVLRQVDSTVDARPSAVPGSGAGTVTVTYQSDRLGIATIAAGRRLCGEDMRCTAGHGSYRLYVVVR